MTHNLWPKIIGGLLGFVIVAYWFVFQPMMANRAQCGTATLCSVTEQGAE